jgi:hypothetical protein
MKGGKRERERGGGKRYIFSSGFSTFHAAVEGGREGGEGRGRAWGRD